MDFYGQVSDDEALYSLSIVTEDMTIILDLKPEDAKAIRTILKWWAKTVD